MLDKKILLNKVGYKNKSHYRLKDNDFCKDEILEI